MTHEELALRIEALDGPDRAVDKEVAKLLGKSHGPYIEKTKLGTVMQWGDMSLPFTRSLDAASALPTLT